MYATDFIYADEYLSDYGFVIGKFEDSGGLKDIQAGSPLTFKTVSRRKGNHFSLVDNVFDSALEITFDICKDPCENTTDEMFITDEEFLGLSRWLLRERFHRLCFVGNIPDVHDYQRYYEGSFNITKLVIDDKLAGLRLIFTANKPYAYGDELSETISLGGSASQSASTVNLTNAAPKQPMTDLKINFMYTYTNNSGVASNITQKKIVRLTHTQYLTSSSTTINKTFTITDGDDIYGGTVDVLDGAVDVSHIKMNVSSDVGITGGVSSISGSYVPYIRIPLARQADASGTTVNTKYVMSSSAANNRAVISQDSLTIYDSTFIGAWIADVEYSVGDLVLRNSAAYKCIEDTPALSSWNEYLNYFERITSTDTAWSAIYQNLLDNGFECVYKLLTPYRIYIKDKYSAVVGNYGSNVDRLTTQDGTISVSYINTTPVVVLDNSHLIGTITPNVRIKLNESGNLVLLNTTTGSITTMKNCTANEVLTFDGENLLISSTDANHDIANDFNYEFLRIQNTVDNNVNQLCSSISCDITITYKPIIRDAP